MKSNYLLPNKYKIFGWVLLLIGLLAGLSLYIYGLDDSFMKTKVFSIYSDPFFGDPSFLDFIENGISDEVVSLTIIIGGLIVGFSKEKTEDEFIYQLRKESLVWAVIFNYLVLMFTIVFVYDMGFFNVLIFNMFTPLLFFIIRFNFLKLKSNSDEE